MPNRTRPPAYNPPLPFHAIRGMTALSVVVVGSILAYFCYQLTADSFKLPWTFLVMLLADLLLLLSLIIGTILYFCVHLSPLLNMLFNTPILLLWTASMALLTWNMYGALGNSCSAANWGNSDGMTICNQYKALYAFIVLGWLCQVALIVLDVRARRGQSKLGRYNKMDDKGSQDLKMDPLDHSRDSSVHNLPLGAGMDGASQRLQQPDQFSQTQQQDPFKDPYQQQQQQQQNQQPQRALTRASSFYSVAPTYATQPPADSYPVAGGYAASQAPTYTTQPPTRYEDTSYRPERVSTGAAYQAYNPSAATSTNRFDPGYSSSNNYGSSDYGYSSGYGQRADQGRYDNYYGR